MVPEKLGQSAKLNSYHCDVDPSFGAGFRPLVIAHQTPVAHQPAEGPLHDPPPGQDLEAGDIVGAFDDLNVQFWAQSSHPLGEFGAAISPVDPHLAQPREPAEHSTQQALGSFALRDAGYSHQHPQHQSQRIDQQMTLATFDFLARVIADISAVAVGFDTLAIQNGGRGAAALALLFPDHRTEPRIDGFPGVVERPFAENSMNRAPGRKSRREQPPRYTSFDDVENGIQDQTPVGGRTPTFGDSREHWFDDGPLGIREVGFVYSGFHRPNRLRLKW